MIAYRKDIDGLRALAILPVILHHLTERGGGYVGVDVFFVISGFLISSILYREVEASTFSLADFYRRRILRIVPALVVMILAVFAAGYVIFLPSEFSRLGESGAAAALSYSNILFWTQSGYFDSDSALKPLLHTWSLGVEEQFYIVFPLLLIVLRKLPRPWLKAVLWVICILSFALANWEIARDRAENAFYLLPSRLWELGLGSLLAVGAVPEIRGRLRQWASPAGLALITGSIVLMTAKTPFPGLFALPACLGAGLIIQSGRGEEGLPLGNRLLSFWPIVLVGQMSYSLYLWHWPVIVFGRLIAEGDGLVANAAFVVVMFGLAWLSWRFVERPFRTMKGVSTSKILSYGAGALAASAVMGFGLLLSHGLVDRLSPPERRIEATLDHDVKAYEGGRCFLTSQDVSSSFDDAYCLRANAPVLLMGDSHAAHLLPGLRAVYGTLSQATASGCKPLIDVYKGGRSTCADVIGRIYDPAFHMNQDGVIIFAARWNADDVRHIRSSVTALRRKASTVVVVGPVPQYEQPVPLIILRGARLHQADYARRHRTEGLEKVDADIDAALRGMPGVIYVSALRHFCEGEVCALSDAQGRPLAWDYGHLTDTGSIDLGHVIARLSPIRTAQGAEPRLSAPL